MMRDAAINIFYTPWEEEGYRDVNKKSDYLRGVGLFDRAVVMAHDSDGIIFRHEIGHVADLGHDHDSNPMNPKLESSTREFTEPQWEKIRKSLS
ncbi:MAG: hypothetical protein H8Z69_00805 [Nanohaloarchaea archaeon]|nr:hypothetical protein [Candidatus Nanohaloarchaea archaeon]